jgi:hypothetical protein
MANRPFGDVGYGSPDFLICATSRAYLAMEVVRSHGSQDLPQ